MIFLTKEEYISINELVLKRSNSQDDGEIMLT